MLYQWLADLVLILHFSLVLFVVLGLPLVWWGNYRHWQWVNSLWFRGLHLLTILTVIAESWLGIVCPLTTWEMQLRSTAGQAVYESSFIQHWLHKFLFFSFPTWVFTLIYSLFGLLVLFTWWKYPPRRSAHK